MLKLSNWQVLPGCLVLLAGLDAAHCGEIEAWDAPFLRRAENSKRTSARLEASPHGRRQAMRGPGQWQITPRRYPRQRGRDRLLQMQGAVKGTTVGLSFFDSLGKVVAPVRSIRLAGRTEAESVVQLTLGSGTAANQVSNLSQVSLKLRLGTSFVEVAGAQRVAGVRVNASMRFALRPDLYGTDVFYSASMASFAGENKVSLPIESYLLCVLNPDSAVLCTWDVGGRNPSLHLSGAGRERQFTALDIGFPDRREHGRSIRVGLLEAPGICRWEDLANKAAQFPENEVVSLQPAWTAPFPARWYTLICHDEQARGNSSLHLPVETWPLAGRIRGEAGNMGQERTAVDGGRPSAQTIPCRLVRRKEVGIGPGEALRAVQRRVELPNGARSPDARLGTDGDRPSAGDGSRDLGTDAGRQGPGAAGKVPRRGEDGHGPLCRAL